MALPQVRPGLRPLWVENRKYIGSKAGLLDFILQVANEVAPRARTAADLFAGSAVVADRLARRGLRVLANDHLYANYLAARCFLTTHAANADAAALDQRLQYLNGLPGQPGYVWTAYGGSYFTAANAARIDAVRETIARWRATREVSEQEEAVLITSLLYAADKVANTCGQYDAFLKHLGREPYNESGRHLVDSCVYRPLDLAMPQWVADGHRHAASCSNAEVLAPSVRADLIYLDPPYNTRQYVDNYHVLENVARWQKPPLYGKTRKFARAELKSRYSRKPTAAAALTQLISTLRCRHILLSYNTEGIVPDAAIMSALSARGRVQVFVRDYAIFGNGAGRCRQRPIQERLFYCRVRL